jgi:hypothetical protein
LFFLVLLGLVKRSLWVPLVRAITPDFPKKTKCISYVRQDQVYTHMLDVMSEISINSNKNIQELNHYIISQLHSDNELEGLYNDKTITMKTQASELLVVAEVLFSSVLL